MKNFALGFLTMYSLITTVVVTNDIRKEMARKEAEKGDSDE